VAKSDQYDLPFRTSVGKEAGGVDDLKVFASEEAADAWFATRKVWRSGMR
jgi:hypothetical protein